MDRLWVPLMHFRITRYYDLPAQGSTGTGLVFAVFNVGLCSPIP
jgi:hypothetical protein